MARHVGVILVHGIGEQGRYGHLEHEARMLARAIDESGMWRASVDLPRGDSSAYLAEQESWRDGARPPVRIVVRDSHGDACVIHCHEAWWADLDLPEGLTKSLGFWFWGLAMWAEPLRRGLSSTRLPGFQWMRSPGRGSDQSHWAWRIWVRFRLFGVGLLFVLMLFSISLLNTVTRRFGVRSITEKLNKTLVEYVDDVRLYRLPRKAGQGPLEDAGMPFRASMRRRMVRAMLQVATAGYDRWFVLAHSLGSVVAFNGVMETGHCLPNYLDRELWQAAVDAGLGGPARPQSIDDVGPTDRMLPRRPVWLNHDDVIYRDRLFARFGGLLTYGSPLEKFATLWPDMVPINGREAVFPADARWINVYDPTDPVGSQLTQFDAVAPAGGPHAALTPRNHAYRAHPVLLVSHIEYMSPKPGASLAALAARWMLDPDAGFDPPGDDPLWLPAGQHAARSTLRYLWWIAATGVLALLAACVLRLPRILDALTPVAAKLGASFGLAPSSPRPAHCAECDDPPGLLARLLECVGSIADRVGLEALFPALQSSLAGRLLAAAVDVTVMAAVAVLLVGVVHRMLAEVRRRADTQAAPPPRSDANPQIPAQA